MKKSVFEKIKKLKSKHLVTFSIILIFLIYIGIIVCIYIIRKLNLASWDAISGLGDWAGILISILIPLVAVYLEKQLGEQKQEIKYSNVSLYNEVVRLQKEIENLKNNQDNIEAITKEDIDKIFANINEDSLKEEIYKFICISMRVTTKEIMQKFSISFEKAKDILFELYSKEQKISVAYIDEDPNDENCTWRKKQDN